SRATIQMQFLEQCSSVFIGGSTESLCKSFGHDFRRADAARIIENDVDSFLRIVRHGNQVHIPGANESCLLQHAPFHPAQQTSPVFTSEEDNRKFRDTLRLHECQDFKEFVERSEPSR